MKKINSILLVLCTIFVASSFAFAMEYAYEYSSNIPTKNEKTLDVVSLMNSVGESDVDIKTEVSIPLFPATINMENVKYFLARRKVSPKITLNFEVVTTNNDKREQDNLELKIFVLNPLGVTRGETSLSLSQFNLEKLESGDIIKVPHLYYQIPSNAISGEWKVYSVIYKETESGKVPISMSTEPQASFKVDYGFYGWGKWIPFCAFILVSILGSAYGDDIIQDSQMRVTASIILGLILAFAL